MSSPKTANISTDQKKDPVTSFICPTTVGIKNEPRFPIDDIILTALPTNIAVCWCSTGIVMAKVKTPIEQSPRAKAKNQTAGP